MDLPSKYQTDLLVTVFYLLPIPLCGFSSFTHLTFRLLFQTISNWDGSGRNSNLCLHSVIRSKRVKANSIYKINAANISVLQE